MSRIVTVYNTIGNNQKQVRSSANMWGELQTDLLSNGVSFSGMTAVIGETQVTLESNQARLIDGDFTLFLMPQKVKSGVSSEGIDPAFGINADERDWTSEYEMPEEYTFKTHQERAKAMIQKALYYLNGVKDTLCDGCQKTNDDPQVSSLQRTADEIKRNMGFFD